MIGPDAEAQHLEPKVMDVLVCLAEHINEVVTRQQLLDVVWAGHTGSDEALTRAIGEIRRMFHDDRGNPVYIETVPKRGYRLIGEVRPFEEPRNEEIVVPTASIGQFTRRRIGTITIALLVLALTFAAYDRYVIKPGLDEAAASNQSIAVLPFVNVSNDPGNEYFSDGISEEIINLLTRVPGLKVIGRTSSFAFKGKNEDLRVIGQKLGVNTLLEGSVRKSGDSVRIVAQLVDVSDGTHIWSETFDRTLTDIFTVQTDVASAVVDALQIHIVEDPQRGRPTNNWEAYTLFLKARVAANRLEWQDAEVLLSKLIDIDPYFAEAQELLAFSYWHMSTVIMDAELAHKRAYEAALAAITMDPDRIVAQAIYRSGGVGSSSLLKNMEAWQWAYHRQPDNLQVLDALAYTLIYAGYFEEAMRVAQRHVQVDPLSPHANLDLFGAYYAAGHTDEAMRMMDLISELGLDLYDWQWAIAGIQLAEGHSKAAIQNFKALLHQYGYHDSDWVRELVTAARDPVSGQAYLDRRIPEIAEMLADDDDVNWRLGLINWYLYFGFIDRYFELILAPSPRDGAWIDADEQIWYVHAFRRLGTTAHPDYLRLASDIGIVDVWNQFGPPDFCRKNGNNWHCD